MECVPFVTSSGSTYQSSQLWPNNEDIPTPWQNHTKPTPREQGQVDGMFEIMNPSNVGALIIRMGLWGVPYCNYSLMGPKTLF